MSHSVPGRRRARRERGATLFVVVLVITLLTGVGLYTVHSSALVAQASGSVRQAVQAEYLAQLGTLASMSEIAAAPAAYVPQALAGADTCRMNQGLQLSGTVPPPCLELSSHRFTLASGAVLFGSDSFGPGKDTATNAAAISGHFLTETTDVAPTLGPVAGMDASGRASMRFFQAKLTTVAQLQPAIAATTGACVAGVMQVTGQHMTRAHVIVGPVGGF